MVSKGPNRIVLIDEVVKSRALDKGSEHGENSSVGSLSGDYGTISHSASGAGRPPTILDQNNESSTETGFGSSRTLLRKPQTPPYRHPMLELLSTSHMNVASS